MEKVEALGRASRDEIEAEEQLKNGMRLGAEYLQGEGGALAGGLTAETGSGSQFRQGLVQTLLRNVMLPRGEETQTMEKAMAGLMELGGGAGDIGAVLGDLQHIITRYIEHRAQLRQQLEKGIRQQMEQLVEQQTGQPGRAMNIDPAMHPRFREEWQRISGELNSQYGQVVEQHKTLLAQRLG